VSFEKLEMGPCLPTYRGLDLGLTKGGVEVSIATESTLITVDQFGETAIDEVIKGRKVTVKVPMAERDLDKLLAVTPGATLVTNGIGKFARKKLTLGSGVGASLRKTSGALVLHPKGMPIEDKSRDFTIPLASCKGDMAFAYKVDDQRVFAVEFNGYVNLETDTLCVFGDPDLVAGDGETVTPIPSPTLTQPTISPSSGAVGTTFSATDGTPTNGTITSRRWLLGTTAIGTGATVTPNATGSLTRENTVLGTNGETIKSTSSPVTVSAAAAVPAPSLSLSSAVTKSEGNSGTAVFSWTLTLNRDGSTAAYPFSWSTVGSGANPADAADFGGAFPAGSGTFAAGETSKTISVIVAGDTAFEPNDTFTLAVTAAGLNTVTSTGTITNDDAAPTVTMSGAQSKSEGNSGATVFTYTVTRSSTTGAINVPWSFTAGSTSASDFTGGSFPAGGNVAMADGVATGTFSISVNGDPSFEPDETFTVLISTPSGYVTGASMSATGTILNDDAFSNLPSTVQIAAEGDSNTTGIGGTPGGINSYVDRGVVSGLTAGPTYTYRKLSLSGQTAAIMASQFANGTGGSGPISVTAGPLGGTGSDVGMGPAFNPNVDMNIGTIMAGTNDGVFQAHDSIMRALRSVMVRAGGVGFQRTLVGTIPSRNNVAFDATDTSVEHNFDGATVPLNQSIRALYSSYLNADYMFDLGSVPELDTAAKVTVDFSGDGTHFKNTAVEYFGPVYSAAINKAVAAPGVRTFGPLTWSWFDHSTAVVLTNANGDAASAIRGADIASLPSGGGGTVVYGYPIIRTGKYCWEVGYTGTPANMMLGVVGHLTKLNKPQSGTVYATNEGIGFNPVANGQVTMLLAAVANAKAEAVPSGGSYLFCVDADADLLWVRPSTSTLFNGSADANPATGVGGIDISQIRALDVAAVGRRNSGYSACCSFRGVGNFVARFTAATMTIPIPSGFKALDQ